MANRILGLEIENNRHLLVILLGLAMALYHLISSQIYIQDAIPHLNTHLGFCLVLVFADSFRKAKGRLNQVVTLALALAAAVSFIYVQVLWQELQLRAYFNTTPDLVIGLILVVLVLEATRRDFGLVLPLLTLIVVLYPIVGRHLPEPFTCSMLDWDQTISNWGIGLQNGIFGIVLPTSANYIFLFVLFGGVLQGLGGTEFFMLLAKRVAGGLQGGPGMMAVVSSSIVGSITGSAAANVAITGSFTIPLMKKVGYKPQHAAAIEAAASNGGQIMPPVMGIVAFGMAGMTGIPYITIIVMALIPALLYFWATGLYVYLRAGQLSIPPMKDKSISNKDLLLTFPAFILPFVVILVLLIKGFSVNFVAFWAIVSSIGISLIVSLIRDKWPTPDQFISGFVKGARAGAGIGASAACVGLIMATVTMSGLGVKISSGIQVWSGGSLFLALIIIAGICVIMGCGGPSLTAYFIVSMFAVPAIQKMGVGFETAHFYTMFFGVFAFLTPPVAVVAMIAAKLAEAPYMASAVEATKAAVGGFIIPFMFVYSPVLLWQSQAVGPALLGISGAILCLLALEIGFVGYFLTHCTWLDRLLAVVAGGCLFAAIVRTDILLLGAGLVLLAILTLLQWNRKSKVAPSPAGAV